MFTLNGLKMKSKNLIKLNRVTMEMNKIIEMSNMLNEYNDATQKAFKLYCDTLQIHNPLFVNDLVFKNVEVKDNNIIYEFIDNDNIFLYSIPFVFFKDVDTFSLTNDLNKEDRMILFYHKLLLNREYLNRDISLTHKLIFEFNNNIDTIKKLDSIHNIDFDFAIQKINKKIIELENDIKIIKIKISDNFNDIQKTLEKFVNIKTKSKYMEVQ